MQRNYNEIPNLESTICKKAGVLNKISFKVSKDYFGFRENPGGTIPNKIDFMFSCVLHIHQGFGQRSGINNDDTDGFSEDM